MPIINNKTITEYDSARQKNLPLIQNNIAYVKGKNPTTANADPQKKPDNRIPIPLAKMAVDSMSGFEGDIEYFWENITTDKSEVDDGKDDPYIELQKEIAYYNETELETLQLYEAALIQGVSYELFWIDVDDDKPGNITPEYIRVPNSEMVLTWSRDLKPKLESALRFQTFGDDHTLDVYYPLKSERWEKLKGTGEWTRNMEGDTVYPYTQVPIAIYAINDDKESFFEPAKPMIDTNDKMLNKSVNEVDRFNGMIAMLPQEIRKEIADKLVEMQVIDSLEQFERWPEYLQKDMSGINEFYGMVTKQVERLFFQILGVVNLSDDSIQGLESGEALRRKMLAMEFVAAKIDMYFKKGLYTRNNLINDVIGEMIDMQPDDYKMIIKITRNLPVDESSKIENAVKINGTVSKKTYLEALPRSIVPDVQKELLLLETEVPEVDLDNIPDLTIED